MTSFGRLPYGRSQHFTFPRRELLQKVVSAAALCFMPSRRKYPKAQFVIGDKISDHWINEFNCETVEYGEICGVCWHPREQEWAYSIEWTHGGMPNQYYPCFDEHLTIGGDLRLVKYA